MARSAGIGPDREGPEEVAILLGQIEALGRDRGRVSGPTAREEDAGLGPAPQDLLHRLARGLGGLHRHLDRAEQLVHQLIRRALLRHALYDSTLTRRGFPCPPRPATASGASSAATSASAWASSSCARTSGACPPASRSATRSCRWASPSGWSRSWTASACSWSASSATSPAPTPGSCRAVAGSPARARRRPRSASCGRRAAIARGVSPS